MKILKTASLGLLLLVLTKKECTSVCEVIFRPESYLKIVTALVKR